MLGQAVGTKGHAEGAGGELPHHRGREGAERANTGVQLVLHGGIVTLLQRSALLCPPVLEPNFDLTIYNLINLLNQVGIFFHRTHLSF